MQTLNDELARIEAEIQRLEVIRDYLRARANGTAKAAPRRRGPRRKGSITAAAAAEKVLAGRKGEPMRTPDLLAAVRAEGSTIADSDGLYKTLSRSDRFKKAGRGLWTLA